MVIAALLEAVVFVSVVAALIVIMVVAVVVVVAVVMVVAVDTEVNMSSGSGDGSGSGSGRGSWIDSGGFLYRAIWATASPSLMVQSPAGRSFFASFGCSVQTMTRPWLVDCHCQGLWQGPFLRTHLSIP